MTRPDARDLVEGVSLAGLIGQWVPLKRAGREFTGLCPFHQERTPSFTVIEHKHFFHCFGCAGGGDALDFLQKYHGWDFREAKSYLQRYAGQSPDEPARPARKPAPPPPTPDKADKVKLAAAVWHETVQADCTAAELYLMGRGIDTAALGGVPPTLRYHRALWHPEAKAKLPAMVGAIKGPGGFCGVHRTYLQSVPKEQAPAAEAA